VQFGAGNNTSINHKLFGSQEEGKNNGVQGASGTGGVIPGKTVPTVVGDSIKEGQNTAAGAMQWFSNNSGGSAIDRAAGMVGEAAKASGVGSNSAVDRAVGMVSDAARTSSPSGSGTPATSTTVVMQGNGEGGLPKLGIEGGMNLAPAGGGGQAPAAPVTPSVSKPSTARSGAKDAGASKPQMPKR
jgi:hypothetical protein